MTPGIPNEMPTNCIACIIQASFRSLQKVDYTTLCQWLGDRGYQLQSLFINIHDLLYHSATGNLSSRTHDSKGYTILRVG